MGAPRITDEQVRKMEYCRSHGMTNEQVARHMGVSYATVLNHIGIQAGKVAEVPEPPPPPKKTPYTVKFTAKEIKFDRSGALVVIGQSGEVSIEIQNELLVFTMAEFKDFADDMKLSLEI